MDFGKTSDISSDGSDYSAKIGNVTLNTSMESGGGECSTSDLPARVSDAAVKKKKLTTKRQRDERHKIAAGTVASKKSKKTAGPSTSSSPHPSSITKHNNRPVELKTGKKDGTTSAGKTRTPQVRRTLPPLLNEAQVVRAVRASLNKVPVIIMPIFLSEDQQS